MLYDLDAFYPVRPGTSNTLYNALRGTLQRHHLLSPTLTYQLTVSTLTDGFPPKFWAPLLNWGPPSLYSPIIQYLHDTYGTRPEILEAVHANNLSITFDDGIDWLRCRLKNHPAFRGAVPVWTRRALLDLRHNHEKTLGQIQKLVGAKSQKRVNQWLT